MRHRECISFDTHCHLDYPHLAEQLDDVLARAKDANVSPNHLYWCETKHGTASH